MNNAVTGDRNMVTRLNNNYNCALCSPLSFSSFPLLSKKPVVRAFLLSKCARLFGFVVTPPLPTDSEERNGKDESINTFQNF